MSTTVKALFRRCARQFLTRQNPPKNKEMVVLVNEKHSSGTDPELRLSLVRNFNFLTRSTRGTLIESRIPRHQLDVTEALNFRSVG